jgi:hypothetical protein
MPIRRGRRRAGGISMNTCVAGDSMRCFLDTEASVPCCPRRPQTPSMATRKSPASSQVRSPTNRHSPAHRTGAGPVPDTPRPRVGDMLLDLRSVVPEACGMRPVPLDLCPRPAMRAMGKRQGRWWGRGSRYCTDDRSCSEMHGIDIGHLRVNVAGCGDRGRPRLLFATSRAVGLRGG